MTKRSRNPYRLPKPLLMNAETPITMEVVRKYIDRHEERLPRYEYLEKLYEGFHDVYNDEDKEAWKPDNRLAVNFPRRLTEDFMGYGYGIPIKKTHQDKTINESIQEFEKINNIEDHEYELGKMCCKFAHAWEFFYQDEEGHTRLSRCTPKEVVMVYDDTMHRKALFAVRYGYHEKADGSQGDMYGEVYTPQWIRRFEDKDFAGEEEINVYGKIPFVEWMLNEEHIGLYEQIAAMNETYSHTVGEKANDVDAFAEAYLAVLGAELDEEGVYKIRDNRIINLYGTDNAKDILVQFLQKPTADGTQENLLNRLDQLIHEISMVPQINDETFSTASSGISLAYKLTPMTNLVRTFNRKITKSIQKRYKIFCTLSTNCTNPDAWKDVEIKFALNIPHNESEETATAKAADGIVSRKTQLSLLSYVDDVEEELKRIEKEKDDSQVSAVEMSIFNGGNKANALQINEPSAVNNNPDEAANAGER